MKRRLSPCHLSQNHALNHRTRLESLSDSGCSRKGGYCAAVLHVMSGFSGEPSEDDVSVFVRRNRGKNNNPSTISPALVPRNRANSLRIWINTHFQHAKAPARRKHFFNMHAGKRMIPG